MVQMTMELPDELAERIRPLSTWIPTVLELSLVGFRTGAAATATEVIEFLSREPTAEDILAYHASERSRERLRRLLALNDAGLLKQSEHRELDELEHIEHILIMLKARAAEHYPRKS